MRGAGGLRHAGRFRSLENLRGILHCVQDDIGRQDDIGHQDDIGRQDDLVASGWLLCVRNV